MLWYHSCKLQAQLTQPRRSVVRLFVPTFASLFGCPAPVFYGYVPDIPILVTVRKFQCVCHPQARLLCVTLKFWPAGFLLVFE